ncbi:BamA/TamA family outer membrane protein [Desulfosediminicola sp.]|uniref:BamA/TamA family outer membrane protein n=1 Tax=Desulfosediminicola sp. TaxID=2886825 RepID=UPI003AF24493
MTSFRNGSVAAAALWLTVGLTGVALGGEEKEEGDFLRYPLGETGNFVLSPIVGPMYTPEMEFGVALGGLLTFSTEPDNPNMPRSSLSTFFIYSTNSSMTISSFLDSFWLDDNLRVNVEFWFKDMPDNYWGVGYDNGLDVDDGPLTTEYDRTWYQLTPVAAFRTVGDLFLGAVFDLNHTSSDDEAPGMIDDPTFQEFGDDNTNVGAGIVLSYDTRDVTVNAWRGIYLNFMTTHYLEALGSDNDYDVIEAEYRQYLPLWREGTTLAWNISTRYTTGEVPWGEMSQVGSPFDLRGYTWGRFRDKTMMYGLLEYRHQFQNSVGELGRHGMVAWVGMGFIGEDYDDFSGNDLPNGGVGYRFELQERMNLRADLGIGRDDAGFYLSINEAF